jgi:ribosomal-protein-alanine N-acetyltransferase
MQLRTERLVLRGWRPSDLEPFAAMNADPRVMRFMPSLLTREQSDAYAARIADHLVVELEGDFIGVTGLSRPTFEAHFISCVEIGWRFRADFHNRGYATEAARAVLAHGFEEMGLDEIVSFTVPHNLPSRRVMEKLGMRFEGEFDHPRLPEGHELRRHVLYRIKRASS